MIKQVRWAAAALRVPMFMDHGAVYEDGEEEGSKHGLRPPSRNHRRTSMVCTARQQGSSSMVVAVRIRPLSAKEVANGGQKCCEVINNKVVVISKAGTAGSYLRSQQGSANEYQFDTAFDDTATQAEVYEGTAKRHVTAVLDGQDVTVFAYGATGAGKTHTMMGSERSHETQRTEPQGVSGIIPMSLVDVFRAVQQCRAQRASCHDRWRVAVSYLEVYNEQIYDLLGPGRQPLAVREDSQKGVVQVAGLSEIEVHSTAQVLDLLRQGNCHRKTESTAANVVSSRSHAVLQVWVRFSAVDDLGNNLTRENKLSLIDLAGSERASATQNRGVRLQEGANINKSLLALANCINALADTGSKAKNNVKYRDSKLTHLLKTSLEGNCRLIMIANINPSQLVHEDSHNTLKYANRAKQIKIKPSSSQLLMQEAPAHVREARLRADNERLRQQLAELRAMLGRHMLPPPPSDLSPIAESGTDNSSRRSSDEGGAGAMTGKKMQGNDDPNSSMISASSFMTSTSVGEAMDLDDAAFASVSHDTELQLERGLLKIAGHPDSPQLSSISGDPDGVIQEMHRTRQFRERLIESLQAQKDEKDRDLQHERKLNESLQAQLKEREQEAQRLREMVVHLRTKLEASQAARATGSDTSWLLESGEAPPGGAAEPAAAPVNDVLGLLSPVRGVMGGASATGPRSSSKKPRASISHHTMSRNVLESSTGDTPCKPARRRVSMIPRPNMTTRRMSVLQCTTGASNANTRTEDQHNVFGVALKPSALEPPGSIGKKRPRVDGDENISAQSAVVPRTKRVTRQSLLPQEKDSVAKGSVAARTRSRQSIGPAQQGRLRF